MATGFAVLASNRALDKISAAARFSRPPECKQGPHLHGNPRYPLCSMNPDASRRTLEIKSSRTLAAHFSPMPQRRYQSGEVDNAGRISRAGNSDVRRAEDNMVVLDGRNDGVLPRQTFRSFPCLHISKLRCSHFEKYDHTRSNREVAYPNLPTANSAKASERDSVIKLLNMS